MAQIKVTTEDFTLTSSWTVTTGSNGELYISSGPSVGSRSVDFAYSIPDDCTVTSAKVHAIFGYPATGNYSGYPKVNRTTISASSDWLVDVTIDPDSTSVNIGFEVKVNGNTNSQGEYTNYIRIEDVYLIIEYEANYTPPELVEYTDQEIISGETYVKAVHMTELHTNVNLVRVARKLDEYAFSDILAMETSLAGWNDHVTEIRTAIDEMSIAHEDWIELGDNYPRLDVLLQLRNVVAAVCTA